MPKGHKKDHRPASLPLSMRNAIRSFLLSCTMRGCRGQESKHRPCWSTSPGSSTCRLSCVAHPGRDASAGRTLKMEGTGNTSLMKELKALWDKDYVSTSSAVAAEWDDPLMTLVTWDCVKKRLVAVASRIQVETMNGEAGDVRYYKEARERLLHHRDRRRQAFAWPHAGGADGQLLPAAVAHVRHADADGRWFGYRPGTSTCAGSSSPKSYGTGASISPRDAGTGKTSTTCR